jgi:exonuclease III
LNCGLTEIDVPFVDVTDAVNGHAASSDLLIVTELYGQGIEVFCTFDSLKNSSVEKWSDFVQQVFPATSLQQRPTLCRIVFWNLKHKDLTEHVCNLARETDTDILILNECEVPIRRTAKELVARADSHYFVPRSNSEDRFHCFCRHAKFDLSEVHKGFRTSVRKFVFGSTGALLGLVHGPDIRNHDSESRQSAAQSLAEEVRFVVSQQGHNRVILIGDFNMNPYDRGMNLPAALNAMMSRACITAGTRKYLGKHYEFYYNPMWSLFGDGNSGPAGTVYNTSNQGPYGWSMLDQTIISHSFVDCFEYVKILTHAGNYCLVDDNGRPDPSKGSDHLPILVKLKGVSRG